MDRAQTSRNIGSMTGLSGLDNDGGVLAFVDLLIIGKTGQRVQDGELGNPLTVLIAVISKFTWAFKRFFKPTRISSCQTIKRVLPETIKMLG